MMNKLFYIAILVAICSVYASAYNFTYNFKCRSRNGWAPGWGRYSSQGEWVNYFGVYAKAGEYVLFHYPRGGHGYWFPRYKCVEI